MPDFVQELQFSCNQIDIFIDVYSGERISKVDQRDLSEMLRALGEFIKLPAGKINIIVHGLGHGLTGILASVEVFGQCHAYTSSVTPSSRAQSISGVIGACLIAVKAGIEAREKIAEGSADDRPDPVIGKIGDPVPVDEILEGFRRDLRGGN